MSGIASRLAATGEDCVAAKILPILTPLLFSLVGSDLRTHHTGHAAIGSDLRTHTTGHGSSAPTPTDPHTHHRGSATPQESLHPLGGEGQGELNLPSPPRSNVRLLQGGQPLSFVFYAIWPSMHWSCRS